MIHAAEFSFHVTQETSVAAAAGDVAEEDKSGSSGDSLVCFVSVEKKDEDAPERVVAEAVRKIVEHHGRVDAETLWLYPYDSDGAFAVHVSRGGGEVEAKGRGSGHGDST